MKISRYRTELGEFFRNVPEASPGESLISLAATEIFRIAACYRDDGDRFLQTGDDVNALASFAYASGWIDMGFYIGIFSHGSPCRYLLGEGEIPSDLSDRLNEKATRYGRILSVACSSCRPSAEPGIAWHDGGVRVIFIASTYLQGGLWYLKTGRANNALALFSYGHGWLDAALRVGLVGITSDRDLFAI